MNNIQLFQGDCIEVMDKLIKQGIKVDAVIADPPYQITACKWDKIIPFDEMWKKLKLLRSDNTLIILFGNEPFSSALRMSNIKEYKYDWVWKKEKGTGFLNAKKQPLRMIENIIVFYKKQPYYNSDGNKLDKPYIHALPKYRSDTFRNVKSFEKEEREYRTYTHEKKRNIIEFPREDNKKNIHPTQKPVALLEYLIKTYTNEGDLVLDFTAGSFSTGIACVNTNRKFIGIELDENYFEIGKKRIEEHISQSQNRGK